MKYDFTKKQLIVSVIISVIVTSALLFFVINNYPTPTQKDYDKLKEITLEIAKDPLNSSIQYDNISTNIKWNFSSSDSELIITATSNSAQIKSTFPVHSEYILDGVIFSIYHDAVQFEEKDLSTSLFVPIIGGIMIGILFLWWLINLFMLYNIIKKRKMQEEKKNEKYSQKKLIQFFGI